jgi:hypothetical protein
MCGTWDATGWIPWDRIEKQGSRGNFQILLERMEWIAFITNREGAKKRGLNSLPLRG